MQILKHILFIGSLTFWFYGFAQKDSLFSNRDSLINAFEPDDAVLAMIDSVISSGYFEVVGYHDFEMDFNKYGYPPDSLPPIDSAIVAPRLAKLNAKSPFTLVYNTYTHNYIKFYAQKRRNVTSKMLGLSDIYFPIFEEALDKHNLPLELKYLPIVESALNPKAKSRVGATGLWQFMYKTGKMYGLEINSYYDERSDIFKSTEAACHYLKKLYSLYGSWDMALAAYNCGPGNVNKAIRRSGGKTSYWEIRDYLPLETRGYVPAFIAVNYIMNYPIEHNIFPKKPDIYCVDIDTIMVKQFLTLRQVSEFLDISYELLEYFNPQYKLGVIPVDDKPLPICLPSAKIGDFLINEHTIYAYKTKKELEDSIAFAQKEPLKPHGDAIVYTVKSGDFLGKIADKYHVRVSQIKDWNNLYSDRLKIGQKLYIYAKPSYAAHNKSKAAADKKMATPKDGKYLYYTIKSGDNLWDIANKFDDVTVEMLQKLNNHLDFNKLKPGMKIKIKPL